MFVVAYYALLAKRLSRAIHVVVFGLDKCSSGDACYQRVSRIACQELEAWPTSPPTLLAHTYTTMDGEIIGCRLVCT